jgi:hypothetical protein
MTGSSRCRYQGEFVDGRREGRGSLSYSNGDSYNGEWMNNLFHGNGIFTTRGFTLALTPHRGQRYEGLYDCGQKHGYGLYHIDDGGVYDGHFEDNL